MNKLVFTFRQNIGDDIVLIANNHKDLEDYLHENFDWYKANVMENIVAIEEREGFETEYATLEWVKHI